MNSMSGAAICAVISALTTTGCATAQRDDNSPPIVDLRGENLMAFDMKMLDCKKYAVYVLKRNAPPGVTDPEEIGARSEVAPQRLVKECLQRAGYIVKN